MHCEFPKMYFFQIFTALCAHCCTTDTSDGFFFLCNFCSFLLLTITFFEAFQDMVFFGSDKLEKWPSLCILDFCSLSGFLLWTLTWYISNWLMYHSLEIRGLCLMKCSSDQMLQKYFFVFHFELLYFFPYIGL